MNMNGKHSGSPPAARSIQDLRAELAKKIAWFIGSSERQDTQIPGLMLVRRTGPTAPCSGTYTLEPDRRCAGQQERRPRPDEVHL